MIGSPVRPGQHRETYNLFLCVLVRGQQVDCLDLTEVNIVTKQEDEQELANIFLLLVTIQCFISLKYTQERGQYWLQLCQECYLELAPDVGQLFVYPLDLGLFTLTVPDV